MDNFAGLWMAVLVTRKKLARPRYRRVFRDVYVSTTTPLTHELRCECAALLLPPHAVITGRSAAALHGVPLALPEDPIEVVAGLETRLFAGPESACAVARCALMRRSRGHGSGSRPAGVPPLTCCWTAHCVIRTACCT